MDGNTVKPASVSGLMEKVAVLESGLNSVILGKPGLIRDFLTGILAGGHILLEGLPGLGKTQLVRAFCLLCHLKDTRIQFTPDLMPLDITGSNILRETGGVHEFEFHPGPIFGNIVLADEINRASPKTQSALLEAMQERRVTVLGKTHELPSPFAVLATQNPIELEGTYPLPEAQLDRFLFKLDVGDVPAEVLEKIITGFDRGSLPKLEAVLSRDEFLAAVEAAARVNLAQPVASYIARLVRGTHASEGGKAAQYVRCGASPRAALAMASGARARAFISGRDTVGFEDVQAIAPAVLRHRLILDYSAKLEGVTADKVVEELLGEVDALQRTQPQSAMERLVGADK